MTLKTESVNVRDVYITQGQGASDLLRLLGLCAWLSGLVDLVGWLVERASLGRSMVA